jgi:hypothetical protein
MHAARRIFGSFVAIRPRIGFAAMRSLDIGIGLLAD